MDRAYLLVKVKVLTMTPPYRYVTSVERYIIYLNLALKCGDVSYVLEVYSLISSTPGF